MLKKIVMTAGLIAGLVANSAWAGNATQCVRLDGQVLVNTCNETIEAAWCVGNGCQFNHGSSWTIQPGQRMPHSGGNNYIRWDACRGANSIKDFHSNGVSCE